MTTRNRNRSFFGFGFAALGLLATCLLCLAPCALADLESEFLDPPHEYSLVPFWAWNGTLDPDEVRRQIDEMVDKGVYAAFMHARPGIESGETPYFSAGWWSAIDAAVEHGKTAGFHPWIYDEDKWPSGSAGGRVMARNPERNHQKVLRREEHTVEGPNSISVGMAGARYVIAARLREDGSLEPASVVALVPKQTWTCPAGRWVLLGYHFEPFGESVNYLNPATVRDFLDITHEEYARRYGDDFGSLIPGVFFDEIMNDAGKKSGMHIWAEGFEEKFLIMKGYDIVPWLPALQYDLGPRTPVIRCDYYDVFTQLYEEAWFKQVSEWCEAHGLKLTGHTVEDLNRYITQGDYMRTMRHLQIPTADNEDFRYTWPRTIGAWKPKQAASIAHLYGQEQAGSEALGGAGWSFTLDSARYGLNMLSAYGLTFFVPHYFGYSMNTPATMDDWPNTWFYQNPYWKYFKTLADHARRVSFMLSGGEPVVDIAILYPQCNQWAGYGPGTTQESLGALVAHQIDADIIDPQSLMDARIEGNVLCAGPMRYRALVVPGVACLRRAELSQIQKFAQAGGTVVVHDRWPEHSAEGGMYDPLVKEMVDRLKTAGVQLTSVEGLDYRIRESFQPDFTHLYTESSPLRYRHLRKEGKDIYWVVNSGTRRISCDLALRATGSLTQWQPEDGSIVQVPSSVVRTDGVTECSKSLQGGQGCFLVFEKSSSNSKKSQGPAKAQRGRREERNLDGPWTFQAVGAALDDTWSCEVKSAELELPVMQVQWLSEGESADPAWQLPDFDEDGWREVKVFDALHPGEGALRYRSPWRGSFISLNAIHPFTLERFYEPMIGGKGFRCRKSFELSPGHIGGDLFVVSPSPFEVFLNEEPVGTGAGGTETAFFNLTVRRPGKNTLEIRTSAATAVLAEGLFVHQDGSLLHFQTDTTWDVAREDEEWQGAWEYVAPPEPPFGTPEPAPRPMPKTALYRVTLPTGTMEILAPEIEGNWSASLDGDPLDFRNGLARLRRPVSGAVLSLRVEMKEGEHGLLKPFRVRCTPVEAPLRSWTEEGLDWYSGRAIYSTTLEMDRAAIESEPGMVIDLGRVGHCAEIWVNGELAGTRVWPPYRLEITRHLKPGKNQIDIVVANLLANRMRWDIFDDVKGSLQHRKWHYETIMRDAWCLESGLMGPVRLLCMKKQN